MNAIIRFYTFLVVFTLFQKIISQKFWDMEPSQFMVDIRFAEFPKEKCPGILFEMKSVIVCNCSSYRPNKVDINSITVSFNKEKRKLKKIKSIKDIFFENGKKPPLFVFVLNEPFSSNVYPAIINGGDLTETCQIVILDEELDEEGVDTFLTRNITALPFEACRRYAPEVELDRKHICYLEYENNNSLKIRSGTPLLCEECLTGVKQYTWVVARGKVNMLVHVYLRMAEFIHWLIDFEGAPIWRIIQSDFEEKMILDSQYYLDLKNDSREGKKYIVKTARLLHPSKISERIRFVFNADLLINTDDGEKYCSKWILHLLATLCVYFQKYFD